MSRLQDLQRDLSLHPNIAPYLLFEVLFATISFVVPMLVQRYLECGLTMSEVTALQAAFATILAIFQIPTGYFADRFGRRTSLLVGCVLACLAEVSYALTDTFSGFLFAELLIALGISFMSGADAALLFDSLKSVQQEHAFPRIRARAVASFLLASALFAATSGFFAERFGFAPMFLVSALAQAGMFATGLCFREARVQSEAQTTHLGVRAFVGLVYRELWLNRFVRWIVLFGGLVHAFNQPSLWFYQPYFQLCGLSLQTTGLLFALFNITAAMAAHNAPTLVTRWGAERLLVLLVVIEGGAYLCLANVLHPLAPLLFLCHQMVRGFHGVLIADLLNAHTSSASRATVNSTASLIALLGYMLVILPMGWIADVTGIQAAFWFAGLGALVCGALLARGRPSTASSVSGCLELAAEP